MKLFFEISSVEYCIEFDYKITSHGCSAHMGSLNYPGHPAEDPEWEIDGDIKLTAVKAPDKVLEIPEWLRTQLEEQIYNDENVIEAVFAADQDDYDDRDDD